MTDLKTLFLQYGWQPAIIGLLGTILVGLIKKPIKNLVNKKAAEETAESTFDTVAFFLGIGVAILFGSLYSLLATKLGWIATVTDGIPYSWTQIFAIYVSNSIGTWLYQITYYQIWKKGGINRILKALLAAIKKPGDKDGDGAISLEEAQEIIKALFIDGNVTKQDISALLARLAPQVLDEFLSQLSTPDDAVDVKAQTDKMKELADELIEALPSGKLKAFASQLLEAVQKQIDEETKKGLTTTALELSDEIDIPATCKGNCKKCESLDCDCRDCKNRYKCEYRPLQDEEFCPYSVGLATIKNQPEGNSNQVTEQTPATTTAATPATLKTENRPKRPTIKF